MGYGMCWGGVAGQAMNAMEARRQMDEQVVVVGGGGGGRGGYGCKDIVGAVQG